MGELVLATLELRTFGFSLRHWKALVKSSVSRAVKPANCLVAILVVVGRKAKMFVVRMGGRDGVGVCSVLVREGSGGGKARVRSSVLLPASVAFHMQVNDLKRGAD